MAYIPGIGAELEGFLVDGSGNPVDTLQVLGGGWKSKERDFEELTLDMGASSIEAVTCICESGSQVQSSLERCLQAVPAGYRPIFQPRPFAGPVAIADKPRARAMRRALAREQVGALCGIDKVAPWCATHYHIGVASMYEPSALLLLNVLNNSAPYARLRVVEKYGIQGAAGHLAIWQGWCERRSRVPAPRWFDTVDQMIGFVSVIPRLVMLVNGVWQLGDGTLSVLGSSESEGTLWWMARPRGAYGTIEWRPFPSMRPEQVGMLADEVLGVARHFWEWIETNPYPDMRRDSADALRLYRDLSRCSNLIPPYPLVDQEWWALYSK